MVKIVKIEYVMGMIYDISNIMESLMKKTTIITAKWRELRLNIIV